MTTPRRHAAARFLLRNAAAPLWVTAALVGLAALASCTVAGSPTASSVTVSKPPVTIDHDLGHGLVWAGPADADINQFLPSTTAGDCSRTSGTIGSGHDRIALTLLGLDCEQSDELPINGSHGSYLEPPPFATDIAAAGTVPTGPLVTFGQIYSEYTNSRNDYTDTVGLVRLADGGAFGVLMLVRTAAVGAYETDPVINAACAIRSAGSASASQSCPTG